MIRKWPIHNINKVIITIIIPLTVVIVVFDLCCYVCILYITSCVSFLFFFVVHILTVFVLCFLLMLRDVVPNRFYLLYKQNVQARSTRPFYPSCSPTAASVTINKNKDEH